MAPDPTPAAASGARSETLLRRLQQRDKNIYLPCVGWIALNSAVIAGALVYG